MKKILGLGFLVFIIYSCSPNAPELPSWETKWDVHLPLKNFTMSEAIDDSLIYADTTNGIPTLKIEISDSTDRNEIKDKDLGIGESSDHFGGKIDEYEVINEETASLSPISVWKLIDSTVIVDNKVPPYPDADVDITDQNTTYERFLSLDLKKGVFFLTLHNNTFVTIRPNMQVKVYNDTIASNLIGTAVFNQEIPPGTTVQSSEINLNNKTIYKNIALRYNVPVKGNPEWYTLSEEDKNGVFQLDATVRNIYVLNAKVKLPDLSKKEAVSIDENMDTNFKVVKGTIKHGSITLDLRNHLTFDTSVEFTLPDLIKDGQPFTKQYLIKAEQPFSETVNLSGYDIYNHINPGAVMDSFYYEVKAKAVNTDGYVQLVGGDSVFTVDASRDSLILAYFEGEIDTVNFDFDPIESDGVGMVENFDGNIRLNQLKMYLDFHNEINFPIFINLSLTGYNSNNPGDSVRVVLENQRIEPSSDNPITTIILDEKSQTPSIVDLLEIMPDKIIVRGNGYVLGEGSVSLGDAVKLIYKVVSPLTVMLNDTLNTALDIETITEEDIDKDTQKKITEELLQVSMNVDLTNSLPIGVKALVILAVDSTQLYSTTIYDSSKKIVINEVVGAGIVDGGGFVGTPARQYITVPLSKTQLQIFNSLPIYIRQVYKVPPTDKNVSFRQNDGVEIDGKISFKLLVDNKEE